MTPNQKLYIGEVILKDIIGEMTGLISGKSLEERIKEKGLLSKKELVDVGLHFYNKVAGIYFYKDKKGNLYFFTKKISKVGEPLYKLHFSRLKDYGKD